MNTLRGSQAGASSNTVSFADVAHQTIFFDPAESSSRLVLELLDTPWMQRLRRIRQTGYTSLVFMFAEHSRFGHSVGVAYLANELMRSLSKHSEEQVAQYREAVAAAAILHDVGHVAPGSHLAERVWSRSGSGEHERLSVRVIREDQTIREILERTKSGLTETVCQILEGSDELPSWVRAIISGGGWNADRGNWTIVDSAMAAVSYGRYNVFALVDAFRLSASGELVLQESRLDALTHFFVARDSLFRQVYQHRVLQGVDALCERIALRLRDLLDLDGAEAYEKFGVFADQTMRAALSAHDYGEELSLTDAFRMSESWWGYHVEQWTEAKDPVLADLSNRLLNRRLLKTIRLDIPSGESDQPLIGLAEKFARELGFDPRYYVFPVKKKDKHRGKEESAPPILLDSGEITAVQRVEPLIAKLLERPDSPRAWLAVPKEVKEKIGRSR